MNLIDMCSSVNCTPTSDEPLNCLPNDLEKCGCGDEIISEDTICGNFDSAVAGIPCL